MSVEEKAIQLEETFKNNEGLLNELVSLIKEDAKYFKLMGCAGFVLKNNEYIIIELIIDDMKSNIWIKL